MMMADGCPAAVDAPQIKKRPASSSDISGTPSQQSITTMMMMVLMMMMRR
jgi:hypothetical protein